MTDLDGAILYGIKNLQSRYNLATSEWLNLKFVVGRLADDLGHHLGTAIKRIERFRPARRHAPFDLRHGLRDRRCCDGCSTTSHAYSGDLDKVSSLHRALPPVGVGQPSLEACCQHGTSRCGFPWRTWVPERSRAAFKGRALTLSTTQDVASYSEPGTLSRVTHFGEIRS